MSLLNKSQPLYLPEGSVRAVLALILTGAAIVASFVEGMPQEYLWPAALVVDSYYFGSAPKRTE